MFKFWHLTPSKDGVSEIYSARTYIIYQLFANRTSIPNKISIMQSTIHFHLKPFPAQNQILFNIESVPSKVPNITYETKK